uniref:NUC domain-containing protein n=1 Tax=Trichuris muris TaxID=70415 RepID=A0A5S6QDS5_TRIMR
MSVTRIKTSWRKIALYLSAAAVPLVLLIIIIILAARQCGVEQNCPPEVNSWQTQIRHRAQCAKGWQKFPVIVISLDGFRADYLNYNLTPTIELLIEAGSHTPFMYASYPTKTFPNHYTIATGLYPEVHGIVDNQMYDPNVGQTEDDHQFSMVHSENTKWWLGEPIWNTVQANGLKSAAYFWPGSDREINGTRPTYWLPYDRKASYYGRFDKVLDWLNLPQNQRPSIINVYLNEPDETGHRFGPESKEIREKLIFLDGLLNYFFISLWRNDLVHCVNTIILADHGMQQVTQNVFLATYVDTNGMIIFPGPVARIVLQDTKMNPDEVYEKLSCRNHPFRIYKRADIPKRFHYSSSNRIGDLIIDGNPGVKVWKDNDSSYYAVQGDHGYDYRMRSMHALFLAVGPDIKSGFKIRKPFQNIEVYNLIADLLDLTYRAPNNGTPGLLHQVLIKPPTLQPPHFVPLKKCLTGGEGALQFCKTCRFGLPQEQSEEQLTELVVSEKKTNLCYTTTASYGLIYDRNINLPSCIYAQIFPSQKMVDELQCIVTDGGNAACREFVQQENFLASKNMSLYPLLPFEESQNNEKFLPKDLIWLTAKWRCPMYSSFYHDVWTYLGQLILRYAQLYRNVLTFAGPIFDYNHDGLFDNEELVKSHSYVPSHYFCIAARCSTDWTPTKVCPGEISTISFAIPHRQKILNCQDRDSYLLMHSAKVKDIELLSGLRFFDSWGTEEALIHRLNEEDMWPQLSSILLRD